MKSRLSDFLKEKRLAANLTQAEVAHKMGYSSPQFVSNWERGVSNPPVETLKELAKLYNASIDDIYEILLKSSIEEVERNLRKKFYKDTKKARRA
ncbi:HTH-type transcriptional regulator ImmR [compost metagenome]